ncbi:DUF6538 domain-containing protein [Paraburkholderia piptadeniae]|uniref:DUF6538 domain-containing protein n=1 Tax=Paraburkholderia piptadeniae TaxID=1701573 RepID=UPI002E270C86
MYRLIAYRGFESPSLRQIDTKFLSSLENPDKSSVLNPLVHEEWYTEDSENLKNKPGLVCRNGTCYARVRVPKLLVDFHQKHEFKRSLRTKNLNEARARLPATAAVATSGRSFGLPASETVGSRNTLPQHQKIRRHIRFVRCIRIAMHAFPRVAVLRVSHRCSCRAFAVSNQMIQRTNNVYFIARIALQ